jgi:hypothetical protein
MSAFDPRRTFDESLIRSAGQNPCESGKIIERLFVVGGLAMQIDFENAGRYLAANVSGPYSLQGMRELIDQIAEESAKRRLERVLVDVSHMTGDAPTVERYQYAQYAAARLHRDVQKCAACAGSGQRLEPFTEVVAQNRGLQLRVFRERAEAVGWLTADTGS